MFLAAWAITLRSLMVLTVRAIPYAVWRPLLRASLRCPASSVGPRSGDLGRLLRAIQTTDRVVPGGRCLDRALTAWLLVRHRGGSRVRLGVAWKTPGELFAHACLEVDGRIVVGQPTCELALLPQAPNARISNEERPG